ncbi:MAG: hypothetical protein Ta2G_10630 [Termitinemataceae bacterium]|nr:MAG: hypothetical protein Ta2G_10630 [Termitinemataceae bacterium]
MPSDQLLRSPFIAALDKYTLMDWVRSEKPKIAYAASFGLDYFEGDENFRSEIGYFLNRFDAVSLREESGVALAKEKFGIDADYVLDPVFLCPRKKYDTLADAGKLRLPDKSFLGSYILDPSPEKARLIMEISENLELKEYRIITDTYYLPLEKIRNMWDLDVLNEASVEEWLAVLRDSKFVITDSFHGICFSIILKKQFIAVFEKKSWRGLTRIESVLKKFCLEDRLIDPEISGLQLLSKPIDYDKVYAILDKEVGLSMEWLKTTFEKCSGLTKNKTTYDILDSRLDSLSEKLKSETILTEQRNHQNLQELEQRIMASHSWRIGRAITWFPRKAREFFKCIKQHGTSYTLKLFLDKAIHKGTSEY